MVNFLPVYDGIDVISLEKLEGITTPIHDVKWQIEEIQRLSSILPSFVNT